MDSIPKNNLPLDHTVIKAITRSVDVSRARVSLRTANSLSSVFIALLSKCASFASFTVVWETLGSTPSNFVCNSSTNRGNRLRVAMLIAEVISVFFSKAEGKKGL
jgi:hypothetical protein